MNIELGQAKREDGAGEVRMAVEVKRGIGKHLVD